MRLYVYVLQAKDLPVKNTYVKLKVGKSKGKTRTLKGGVDPVWNEEFVFRVHDIEEDIVVSVFNYEDEDADHGDNHDGFFHGSGDLMGRVHFPVWSVANEDNQTLPPTWFPLENTQPGKFISKDCGKILVTISLHGEGHDAFSTDPFYAPSNISINDSEEIQIPHDTLSSETHHWKMAEGKHLMKAIASRLEKMFNKNEEASGTDESSELSSSKSDYEDCLEEHPPSCSFEEAMEIMELRNNNQEMPDNLQGGILIDQPYLVSSTDLNKFLFAPNSQFRKDLAELQGTTDLQEGPWMWKSEEISYLTRVVTCIKAATKLVKAVKATEEQTYINANRKGFAVFVSVATPDVPYGSVFKVELLYKIIPGCELSSEEESSRLIVSWGINFLQNTMMRGMIEGGVRRGLKESFDQFACLLAQNLKVLHFVDMSDNEIMLASLQTENQSDWQLAFQYFWNFTTLVTLFMLFFVLLHILRCKRSEVQGLEFYGLDLPDSLGELITCGVLFIQLESVYNMVSHFVQARLQSGSDQGVKAQGNGWVLTVALMEGTNLASLESSGFLDPYVVFTCNGKTKASSVKLRTCNPQWNEIFEFDAMEEPPSVLDVEVFDFHGPFNHAISVGHAEINFLKHSSAELANLSIALEGKLAQSSQSKLHLRIFLNNNKGVETIKEYLTKMEKEVGKKLTPRSPHRNLAFQKLFRLPPEEFLINDFTCHLKRKFPMQGRLFLSARIMGFYANFFGHKTKFYFLWEDIEDIKVLPPSLSSVGSPSLVIVLQKGRGLDASNSAKMQDESGRLKFYFQSFMSFNVASRTIMALWRTRTLTPEQKAQVVEELQDQEEKCNLIENDGSILGMEDVKMSKIYTAELPTNVESLMQLFDGGEFEHKILEKSGCHNYAVTKWELVKPGVFERHLSYKFSRRVSIFGGEVTCIQQRSPTENDEGWIVNETMSLHEFPFGDHFRVHFKYQIEKSGLAHNVCKCDVYIGITWLKSNRFQQRITKNIAEKFRHRLEEMFEMIKREILSATTNTME